MSAIAAPTKEVPKGFVWRRLHSNLMRFGSRDLGKTRGLLASVLLDASLLHRALGVNLTIPQPTGLKSCVLELLRKPKNRTPAALPREPTKKAQASCTLGAWEIKKRRRRADGSASPPLPEPPDPRGKRHRRAEPAEGTTRENT